MKKPCYIDLEEAREVLAGLGVSLTPRQMKRASEKNIHGQRKLPFFLDPIENKLKINKNTLLEIYFTRQIQAERNIKL